MQGFIIYSGMPFFTLSGHGVLEQGWGTSGLGAEYGPAKPLIKPL